MLRSARRSSAFAVPLSTANPRTARGLVTSSFSSPHSLFSSNLRLRTRSIHNGFPCRSASSSRRISEAFLEPRSGRQFHATTYTMVEQRAETDAFGEVLVPGDRYWGAQTERSLENFRINQPQDRMPPPIIIAFGILKGAAATVNMKFGLGIPLIRVNLHRIWAHDYDRSQNWQSHPASSLRSSRPQADRTLSPGCLADWLRNTVEHECK